jgi:hypothetical protein
MINLSIKDEIIPYIFEMEIPKKLGEVGVFLCGTKTNE